MNGKKWLIIFSIFSLIGISSVGLVNYIIDPLWCFSHTNQFNKKQKGFNERQQKTNFVNFHNLDNFDGVLLGSSRTTFINQNDFIGMNIYNYASSSMRPYEYKGYIDFFKKKKEADLKYIIIGSDFYGTGIPKDVKFEKPEFYIENTQGILYRYKMLLSIDALKTSAHNVLGKLRGLPQYYSRNNVKFQPKVSEKERLERYTRNIIRHTKNLTGDEYSWDDSYESILRQIKYDNPNSKFIVFTSPVTADLLISIIKTGKRINEYERWLRLLIDVFGEVHHYMTINSITTNLENYPDDDHYYPHIAKLLANKLSGTDHKNVPKDFGIILNQSNIDEFIKDFKREVEPYQSPIDRLK
jgi:hypothetical protein